MILIFYKQKSGYKLVDHLGAFLKTNHVNALKQGVF